MRPAKIKIELTEGQIRLIYWALHAGKDQFQKHLMHDGWDDPCVPRSIVKEARQIHQQLSRAIKTFAEKVRKGRSAP